MSGARIADGYDLDGLSDLDLVGVGELETVATDGGRDVEDEDVPPGRIICWE